MSYLLNADVIIGFLKRKEAGFSKVSGLIAKDVSISVVAWIEIIYG